MNARRVAPFPWHALASTTRATARAAHGLRSAAENMVKIAEVARALGEIVNARIEIFLRHVSTGGATAGEDPGVLLALADDPLTMGLVEVEPALAAALCARVIRRKAPRIVDPTRVTSEDVAGALGAILVAAARRVHAGAPLTLRAAGPARAIAPSLGADVAVASLTVLVDDDAYLARASIPRPHASSARRAPWDAAALAALGHTPLAIPIIAAATIATTADVASLTPGDAWIPGQWSLGAPPSGRLKGTVVLASPGADNGVSASLGEDGRLVLLGERVELAMEQRNINESVSQAIGDVPVVVRVEIGAAEMPAREWAAIGKGDVIALGTKIADPVVLRVGNVEVARGELVEIEGEVGVRILSLGRS